MSQKIKTFTEFLTDLLKASNQRDYESTFFLDWNSSCIMNRSRNTKSEIFNEDVATVREECMPLGWRQRTLIHSRNGKNNMTSELNSLKIHTHFDEVRISTLTYTDM